MFTPFSIYICLFALRYKKIALQQKMNQYPVKQGKYLGAKMQVCFVYVTVDLFQEAEKIGKKLVESRLAACVNIIRNVHSIYEWEGKLEQSAECILIAKSRLELFDKLKAEILVLHSADCPCIVQLPVEQGHSPFLEWIYTQTQSS